uniref:Uncharacterized protein n=1 Tax=Arion vulgaris TaxID=1028688 RepID=A0A0B6YVE6_9EUPU
MMQWGQLMKHLVPNNTNILYSMMCMKSNPIHILLTGLCYKHNSCGGSEIIEYVTCIKVSTKGMRSISQTAAAFQKYKLVETDIGKLI